MLRLFRHIRQRLFLEGKASRYFGYAVGEIVLIVVGILIALEANEWKEERRYRIEERNVLARISEEIHVHLNNRVPFYLEQFDRGKTALQDVEAAFNGTTQMSHKEFLNAVLASGASSYFTPPLEIDTFEEIVSGGKLGLIHDLHLRNRIKRYYRTYDNIIGRGESTKGEYGRISYNLVPRDGYTGPLPDLSDAAEAEIVDLVLKSDLGRHVISQRNRLNALTANYSILKDRGEEIQEEIQTYLSN